MYRGVATFTLDYGKCPAWLFRRMVKLARELTRVIVVEYGPEEFIRRLADPVWFQSLGTVLAFDWNSSGLTTILTAALKEAVRAEARDLGIFICGGKGKTSRQTPAEIQNWGEVLSLPEREVDDLVYHSKMAAKVDSALVQDGFQIYHHSFFFSLRRAQGKPEIGAWAVVQQGMNAFNQTARRYHWFSRNVQDLICEPHSGIVSQQKENNVLNLTAKDSGQNRQISNELVSQSFKSLMKDVRLLRRHYTPFSQMIEFEKGQRRLKFLNLENKEYRWQPVAGEDFSRSRYLEKILWRLCEEKPANYEKILATAGVGPKTMRALALVAELIYGAEPSYKDPARYSFAHGGKDATPYPVDRQTYDQTIGIMKNLVDKMKIDFSEKRRIKTQLEKN